MNLYVGKLDSIAILMSKMPESISFDEIINFLSILEDYGFILFGSINEIDSYPEVFQKHLDENGAITFSKGNKFSSEFGYVSRHYHPAIISYIVRITNKYLDRKSASLVYSRKKKRL